MSFGGLGLRLGPRMLASETLASVIGHEVSRLGYGASLDYSFCFDTVDLRLLKISLGQSLPDGLARWSNLLIGHWMALRRWVSNSGSVLGSAICLPCGIPQGDAASPLLLALYLWEGYCRVESYLHSSGAEFYQAVYMDDRTVVASRPDAVEGAVNEWAAYAKQRKLLENQQKAQWISIDIQLEGYGSSMEVLGVLIGAEDPLGLRINPKQEKRLQVALDLVDRIGLLPEAKWLKLKDIAIYVQGVFAYGWVNSSPCLEQQKHLRARFNRALGGHPYGVPVQIRTLAKRNRAIECMGKQIVECALDQMVNRGLGKFGWVKHGATWRFGAHSFLLQNCCDNFLWGKISHSLRESIRQWHYAQLLELDRHEFVGQVVPPYSEERVKLVKEWISDDSLAMLLATGSIASSRSRSRGQPLVDIPCPRCGILQAFWGHYWLCWMECDPPADLLLRRFLWPRNRQDLGMCNIFKSWAGQLVQLHKIASWEN